MPSTVTSIDFEARKPAEQRGRVRRSGAVAPTVPRQAKVASGGSPIAPLPVSSPHVSIVVPTYRESENLPELVRRVKDVADRCELDLELLIVDDASGDGTDDLIGGLGEGDWLRLVSRTGRRSLSRAVLQGMGLARGAVLVIMDGDLSHPPEAVPELVQAIDDGKADLVIGSRFVAGGRVDPEWSAIRRLNSRLSRWLARPLTDVADSTSGFLALSRATYESVDELDPIGYKIGLEMIVKTGGASILEVPIHFSDRKLGTTKLGWRQRIEYLEHLRRLTAYRWRTRSHRTL